MTNEDASTYNLVEDGHVGGFMSGGDPATWSPSLWLWLIHKFHVQSVIDIGCGQGYAVSFFKGQGLAATGLDGSLEAISSSVAPSAVVQHDFYQSAYLPAGTVDMVWSCEFIEHIEEKYLENVLSSLSKAGKVIALTHAFPGQPGHHHVNCQPTIYWIGLLRRAGFEFSLLNTLAARWVAMKDYSHMNHFGRSGLVFFVPIAMGGHASAVPLQQLLHAGRHPDIASRWFGLILKGQNLALRVGRKFGFW